MDPLHELPYQHPVGLFQNVADIKLLGFCRVTPEN
jgi:hypothetical protein